MHAGWDADAGMMRHAASAAAAWTAPGEVWEYVSELVSSYHDQHDCQVRTTLQDTPQHGMTHTSPINDLQFTC